MCFIQWPLKRRVIWHHQPIELVKEIGKRTTTITGDPKETAYLFQQLYVALLINLLVIIEIPTMICVNFCVLVS